MQWISSFDDENRLSGLSRVFMRWEISLEWKYEKELRQNVKRFIDNKSFSVYELPILQVDLRHEKATLIEDDKQSFTWHTDRGHEP